MAKKHLPSFQFYPADWLKDPKLKRCSFQNKGIWIDILCYLHESDTRGKITATPSEWCRLIGCSEEEFNEFLSENSLKKFADISQCNGFVTIKNRRMIRDERARQSTRDRVKKHRCNASVTALKQKCNAYSSSSSSDISSDINNIYIVHKRIFEHWNSKRIIKHKSFEKFKSVINSRLKDYSEEEITQAIDNYHTVLTGDEYFWSYKWGLDDFLKPDNLDRFLTENKPLENFRKEVKNESAKRTGPRITELEFDKYARIYES